MSNPADATNTGLLRRFASIAYDTLLVAAVLFLATIPFIAIRGGESVEPRTLSYQVAVLVVIYAFFVGFWSSKGRTLGMQSWGLQLEDANGRVPGVGACSVRFAVSLISWAALGLGFLWQLVDRDSLTWHDRASGTRTRYYPKPKKAKQQKGKSEQAEAS
ncbi:MAG: RDD family protein [Pseudomonadota bacterium]